MKKILFILFIGLLSGCTPQTLIDTASYFAGDEMKEAPIVFEPKNDQDTTAALDPAFEPTLQPSDCLDNEAYDPETQSCYFECSTDEECAAIEQQIQDAIDQFSQEIYEGDDGFTKTPSTQPPQETDSNNTSANSDDEIDELIRYSVTHFKLDAGEKKESPTEEEKLFIEDATKHQRMWEYFNTLFPESIRIHVSHFSVFTDGKEGTYGAVHQSEADPEKWVLSMDIQDAFEGNEFNSKELTYTLVHEFAHLLTLNKTQLDINSGVYYIETGQSVEEIFEQKKQECAPRIFLEEGCSFDASTINQYYQKYWRPIENEHEEIQKIEDEDQFYDAMNSFYERHQDQFVTDYASTNLGEDIAESFTAFVLREKPTGTSIADQKVLFFYNSSFMTELRNYIRSQIVREAG